MWKLPAGLIDKEGQVHREVEVREMTGHDEELLLGSKGKNFARVTTKLLAACVTRVGALKPSEDDLRAMLVGDRNYLLLAVRIASLGPEIEFSIHCPSCKAKNNVIQDLQELPIRELADPTETTVTVKLPSPVATPDGHEATSAECKFLTGKDQEELSQFGDDAAGLINATLVKTIMKVGSWDKVTTEFVKGMTKRCRDSIMLKMKDMTPGVDMNVEVECGACGVKFETPVGMEGFFVSRVA